MNSQTLLTSEFKDSTSVFGHPSFDEHEQVMFCFDKDTGLRAIIGIHNTVLGPALGGTRMWNYASEREALNDVLRLSRGMTYKSAITGLNLGGGKAVIMGDAKTQKTRQLMTRFAEFVHSLGGKYITAEDVGMETADMDLIRQTTPYVTGISESKGGAGNPSPITAYGVFMGMKAASKYLFGTDSLQGRKIIVQGVGHVGEALVGHISSEGAQVFITDIDSERLEKIHRQYGASIYTLPDIYSAEVDIYAPCALGATINDDTVYKINTKIIAGAANNQLADEEKHGRILQERGIVYAPDFLINAGGIINVYAELEGYGKAEIIKKTENIYNTTLEILAHARTNQCTPQEAALSIAKARIAARKAERKKN